MVGPSYQLMSNLERRLSKPALDKLVEPVQTKRKSDQIVDQLKSLLAKGLLQPGQSFPAERDLSQAFGVSRSSVREAIRTLENQRLIERTGKRRVIIRNLTDDLMPPALVDLLVDRPESLIPYYEARLKVELGVIDLAAVRRTDEDLAAIKASLDSLSLGMNRFGAAAEPDMQFHRRVAAAAHNPILSHLMISLLRTQQRAMFLLPQIYSRRAIQKAIEDHRLIYEGIERKDADLAKSALDQSLTYAMEVIASIETD